jgi:hypothetical protein
MSVTGGKQTFAHDPQWVANGHGAARLPGTTGERGYSPMVRKAATKPLATAVGVGVGALVAGVAILLSLIGVPMAWLEPWHIGTAVGATSVAILTAMQRKRT